jgi:hypothetical protein
MAIRHVGRIDARLLGHLDGHRRELAVLVPNQA